MNPLFFAGLFAAIVALIMAVLTVPLVTRVATAFRAVDYPGGRRLHGAAIPRMGGIAIAVGIAAGAGLPSLWFWSEWGTGVTRLELMALIIGTGLVFLVGLSDDLLGLSPIQRFGCQVVAAVGVVYAGWSFDTFYVPLMGEVGLGLWGPLVTVVWIVGVTNAINLLDGLDGLAGGVAAIIAGSILVFSWIQGNALSVILMAAIVGASVGFLRHNWALARIYMGDCGSLSLGFLLAVMSLHGSIKGATTVAILVPILALGLPVIDTLLVMAVRFVEQPQGSFVRRFVRMFRADRNHLHHLLAHAAPSRKPIVVWIYAVVASFCGMALIVALSRSATLGIALILVEVIVVLLLRNLGIRREVQALSLEQRQQVRAGFFGVGNEGLGVRNTMGSVLEEAGFGRVRPSGVETRAQRADWQ